MTRCWALELARNGIRVNAVAAGPTESDLLSERMKLSAEQIESTLSGVSKGDSISCSLNDAV